MINGHLRRMLYMYRYGSKSKRTLLICGHTKLLILTVTVVHRLRVQEFGRFRPQSCKADKLARKPPAISLDLARNLVSYQKNLFHDMHEIASCTTWTTRVKCSELGNNSNVSEKKESLIKLQRNQMREKENMIEKKVTTRERISCFQEENVQRRPWWLCLCICWWRSSPGVSVSLRVTLSSMPSWPLVFSTMIPRVVDLLDICLLMPSSSSYSLFDSLLTLMQLLFADYSARDAAFLVMLVMEKP